MTTRSLTAIIERDDDLWLALCPELDIASQGSTVEEARANLREAIELFFECAEPTEPSTSRDYANETGYGEDARSFAR